MVPRPTLLEKLLGARINLKLFGFYIGTGHYIISNNLYEDTESENSDSESSIE